MTEAREPYILYWETASIDEDTLQLNVCYNGQQSFSYLKDNPHYKKMLDGALQKFPELTPGKLGQYYRYSNGKTKVNIIDYD